METLGYSERGVLNTLFFEAQYSAAPERRLEMLMGLFRFSKANHCPGKITDALVLIEQSYSDFGDADATLLLDGVRRECVFIEAKVKTCGRADWRIEDEWSNFLRLVQSGNSDSNLFIQLYRKQRLANHLRAVRANPNHVSAPCAIAQRWSLGTNEVVLRAAGLLDSYVDRPFFVGIVPDDPARIQAFVSSAKPNLTGQLPDFDMSEWGFFSWHDLYAMCATGSDWPNTLSCLEFNSGQIFGMPVAAVPLPPPGTLVKWTHGGKVILVTLKRRGALVDKPPGGPFSRVEATVAKNRNGPTGSVTLALNAATGVLTDGHAQTDSPPVW
jgi:hypothetical protein